jgi:hypothetical protein
MTRRGAWRSDVAVLSEPVRVARGDVSLLLCARGCWRLDTESVAALQGLLLEGPGDDISVAPLEPGATLLHVRLCHDRRP